MSGPGALARLLTGTAEVCHDVDDSHLDDLDEAARLGDSVDLVMYELVGLGSRIREACIRAGVNGTPRPVPVKPIQPKNPPPPPPPKDSTADSYSAMCETLDGYANARLAEGTLRAFETLDGAVLLGVVDEGEPIYYGEIEGYPEGVSRSFADDDVGGVRDVFVLAGDGPVEFPWQAWADTVHVTVDGIRIPDGLRARIGAAASIADSMADQASVLGWFTRAIDAEIVEVANANTHAGQDNEPLLDLLLDTLTRPLGQRVKLACGRMDDTIGQLIGPVEEPLPGLDGEPRSDIS